MLQYFSGGSTAVMVYLFFLLNARPPAGKIHFSNGQHRLVLPLLPRSVFAECIRCYELNHKDKCTCSKPQRTWQQTLYLNECAFAVNELGSHEIEVGLSVEY